MRIALANAFLPTSQHGGVGFQVHYLANALVGRGHHVTVFSCSKRPDDALYEVHQFSLPPSTRPRLIAFYQAINLARIDFSLYDVVHTHGDNYLLWNVPHQVRTFHGSALDEARSASSTARRIFYTIMHGLECLGERVATINTAVSKASRAHLKHIEQVVPCGIDLQRFQADVKSREPSILFVGGMGGRKRGSFLQKIFAEEVKPCIPNAQLWLVADDVVGDVADGIRVIGKVPLEKLIELYGSAWVFCMPSTYEGFGVPYLEAMASDAVAVASPNPGALEVLDGGRYGVVAGDEQLGSALSDLLANADARSRYVDLGRSRVARYDWSAVCSEYEQIFERARVNRSTFLSRLRHRS